MHIIGKTASIRQLWVSILLQFALLPGTWAQPPSPNEMSAYYYSTEGDSVGWHVLPEEVMPVGEGLNIIVSYWTGPSNDSTELSFQRSLQNWLINPQLQATIPVPNSYDEDSEDTTEGATEDSSADSTGDTSEARSDNCPRGNCSTINECRPIYECLYDSTERLSITVNAYPGGHTPLWWEGYQLCFIPKQANITSPNGLQCGFKLLNTTEFVSPGDQLPDCATDYWNLTTDNWRESNADRNLQTFITGGADSQGVWWQGWDRTTGFSEALGFQLLNYGTFSCRLELPCAVPLYCKDVGSRLNFGTGKPVSQSRWGFFVMASLEHINQQLNNMYQALQSATLRSTLTVFRIDDFYPVGTKDIGFLDLITGLGTIFAVSGGFAPAAIAPGLSTLSAIIPTLGTYFDRHADMAQPLKPQREFAPYLEAVYGLFVSTLQDIGILLFNGSSIDGTDGNFTIVDMMKKGAWVEPKTVEQLTGLEEQLRVEILSRSINNFWLKPANSSHNKMWVTFYNLNDDEAHTLCFGDTSGPQTLKYCADGGVYYGYNFIEDGTNLGHLGYSWGTEKLPELGIPANACLPTKSSPSSPSIPHIQSF